MNFKVGDKVAVLDDVIKGNVISINQDIIELEDATGMRYQFESSELVKIYQDQRELLRYAASDAKFLQEKLESVPSKKTQFKKIKNESIMEVDLHANKLVKSTRGMDNFDVLNLQIETAKRKLIYCIEKRISKIVFIHGVGEGVLKAELHSLLNNYPVKYYDASYNEYGSGATEVYVFQNV